MLTTSYLNLAYLVQTFILASTIINPLWSLSSSSESIEIGRCEKEEEGEEMVETLPPRSAMIGQGRGMMMSNDQETFHQSRRWILLGGTVSILSLDFVSFLNHPISFFSVSSLVS